MSSSSPAGSKLRSRVERRPGSGWRLRASSWRSDRRSSARTSRRRDAASSVWAIAANWTASSRPPRAARSTAGPTSCAPPIPALGRSASRARTCDVSSRPISTSTGSADGWSASARRLPGGNPVTAARRSRTWGNSSRAIDLASIRRGDPAVAVLAHHEPPRAIRPPRPGVRHADTGGGHDLARRVAAPGRLQAQGAGRVEEVEPVVTTLDAEGGGEVRRAGRQARSRQPRDPGGLGLGVGRSGATSRHRGGKTCHPHGRHALERLHGAEKDGGAVPGGARDDVEAEVHPVDTVHVRMARRAEHRGRARPGPEPGVRGTVLGAGVRLHLDDPAGAAALSSLAHEKDPDQAAGCLDDVTREEEGQVSRGRQVYISARSGGTIQPNRVKKSGMSDVAEELDHVGRVVEGVDVAQDPQLVGVREDARLGVVRVQGDDERAHEQERLDRAQDPAEDLVHHGRLREHDRLPVEGLDRDGAEDVDHQEAPAEREHVDVGLRQLPPVLGQPGAERVTQVEREQQRHQRDGEPERATQRPLDVAHHEEGRHEEDDQDVEEVEPLDELDDVHAASASERLRRPFVRLAVVPRRPSATLRSAFRSSQPLPARARTGRASNQARRRPPWAAATSATRRSSSASTSPSSRARSSARIVSRHARLFSASASGAPR